jgi:CspA family cold shock protein
MPQGKIKRLVSDRGFGFVEAGQNDMFFHHSDVEGVSFDELREGQTLQYEKGQGPKGPRATNVRLVLENVQAG